MLRNATENADVSGKQKEDLANEKEGESWGADLSDIQVDTTGEDSDTTGDSIDIELQVKDIVEDAIEDKLDNNHFPFLSGQRQGSSGKQAPTRFIT